jgi:CspA family cold shock protein
MLTGNVAEKTIDSVIETATGSITGTVKWFNNAKGYGFIVADGGEVDLFAHYSSIAMEGYKTLKAGQAVTFDTKAVENGTHAINISAIAESAPEEEVPAKEEQVMRELEDEMS